MFINTKKILGILKEWKWIVSYSLKNAQNQICESLDVLKKYLVM